MYKELVKPFFIDIFGPKSPKAVAKWEIKGIAYYEVIDKVDGTVTGGWKYEAS